MTRRDSPCFSGWPRDGGECGDLLRSNNWSQSTLGPIETWSESLRTTAGIVLGSPLPMALMWGRDHIMIYNDHYIPMVPGKHPHAFGQAVSDVWPELRGWNDDVLCAGMNGGECDYLIQGLGPVWDDRCEHLRLNLGYSPVRDHTGEIAGVLCTGSIAKDRVFAAGAPSESEHRYRLIVENSPDLIFLHQKNKITFVNPTGVRLLGARTADEILGRDLLDLVHPDSYDVAGKRISVAPEPDSISPATEIKILGLDGRVLEMETRTISCRLGSETVVQVVCRDITEKNITNRKLHECQQQFRQYADTMPLVVWTASPTGEVDYASRQLHEYTGKTDEEILGDKWIEIIHPEDLPRCLAAWKVATASGEQYECEFRIRGEDGAFSWYSVSAVPVSGQDGKVLKWIGTALNIHYRKSAEDASTELAQRLTNTLESITDGFCTFDRDWRFTYLNSEAERLLRRSHSDLLGKVYWEEFPHIINTAVYEAARNAVEKAEKTSLEVFYEPFEAWLSVSIYPSAGGSALYFQDITTRRKDEQQLRLLQTAVAKINDIIIITEADPIDEPGPRIIFVNDAFVQRTGYTKDEVIGKSPRFLQKSTTQREDLDTIGAALKKLEPVRAELINYKKNGEDFWLEMDIVPIVDAHRTSTNFVAVGRDVTEQKKAQQNLRESEARFRAVAKATADLVWDWNIITDRVWWNDEFLNLYGRRPTPEEPGLAALSERLHQDDRDRVISSISSALAGSDEYWAAEYRLVRANGSIVHLIDSAFIVRDAIGSAIRMVGGIRDVTERVEIESKHRQSQRLETIGQLTGGVAHDFNNLLTIILGNAEILEESLAGDQRLRSLAEMTRIAAERGADLTHRLLAFARRQPLDPSSVDINRLVADMDGLLKRMVMEDIEIDLVSRDGLWEAHVDAPQLESAMLNLAINARDAMPYGGRLTIESANVHLDENAAAAGDINPGQYVVVVVSDTGCGMTPEVIEQAVQPFFTTKEVGKGSGLGLSMVYGFVKQSGGHIKIYSEVGHGTTVRLYLPRAPQQGEQSDMHTEQAQAIRGREKILIAEDDELVRNHVSAQLTALGYNIVAVSNGPEALEAVRQIHDIELLFTDVVMPGGLNGRQLAEKVFQLRPELPVLFTSGYAENAIVHHGRLDAGVHLLNKPYRRKDLAAKVRLVLDEAYGGSHQKETT